MKIFKGVIAVFVLYIFFISVSTFFSGCTKKEITHDTTVVNHHDTTIIVDTVYDLTDGLVAYYNFNGGSLHDSSGNGNDIVFNNASQTSDRFGKANNAYLFNGTSSYMKVNNSPSLNSSEITIYAIVKVSGFYPGQCGGNQILSKGYPYNINGFYELGFNDPTSNCGVTNTNNEIFYGISGDNNPQGTAPTAGTDTVLVKTGQWYKLAYTYDGETAKLYINGVLKDSRIKSGIFTANSYNLFIGMHENPSFPYYFNGAMDEIRIYNRPLSQTIITRLNNLTN